MGALEAFTVCPQIPDDLKHSKLGLLFKHPELQPLFFTFLLSFMGVTTAKQPQASYCVFMKLYSF